jgi:ribonuclease PH
MRSDGRTSDELRSINIELSPVIYPKGSVLIQMGHTHVLCAVSVQEGVPRWLEDSAQGWLTAEYALLPGSTQTRTPRSHVQGGRAQEIRRLIGRSLRCALDRKRISGYTFIVDCDVLQADGGTRTAAITGGYVAVAMAIHALAQKGLILEQALNSPLAAVSVGLVDSEPMLDLAYVEDAHAQMDLNVVMDAHNRFIEIQGTAERDPIDRATLATLLDLAARGIERLIRIQRETLACAGIKV